MEQMTEEIIDDLNHTEIDFTDSKFEGDVRMTKRCKWCGREYEVTHHSQKYCSKECTLEVNRERAREHARTQNLLKKLENCCRKHGGVDNCPYPDCIRE